jgi:predicted MFS family arabinose efflux permease
MRQSIVPDRLVGRVNSAFQLLSMGMLPLGAAVGGVLARGFGLRAPFLVTGAAQLVLTLLAVPIVRRDAGQPVRLA